MLYFSKLRVFSVLIFTLIISYFTISNFTKVDDEFFSKNIKLGLDLQGGSYLLLELELRASCYRDGAVRTSSCTSIVYDELRSG